MRKKTQWPKPDIIERAHGCLIHHGPLNQRAYIMGLGPACFPRALNHAEELAARNQYTKLMLKAPAVLLKKLEARGYQQEAVIPDLWAPGEDALYLAKFLDGRRAAPAPGESSAEVRKVTVQAEPIARPDASSVVECGPDEAAELARLYSETFGDYPFPVDDPGYIIKTMRESTLYLCVRQGGLIAAAAAAEMDPVHGGAEMTDFAVRPKFRGRNLAPMLLAGLEEAVAARGIRVGFSIARVSPKAMGAVFARMGYSLGGVLVNSTWMDGRLRSMAVWYKRLRQMGAGGLAENTA